MEKILDFTGAFDVTLFDNVVDCFYSQRNQQEAQQAMTVLTQFLNHADAWTRVDSILENSSNINSKFLALQALDKCIQLRWRILPQEQRDAVKQYIVQLVIKISSDAEQYRNPAIKPFMTKLNTTLISIVKQEWTATWTSFVVDLVASAQNSETLCENNLILLRLLSEEVFDYGEDAMTLQKVQRLKDAYNNDFAQVFHLCEVVFDNASTQPTSLVEETLLTCLSFIPWIPRSFVFETKLIETLIQKLFPIADHRNSALECLTEIGGLKMNDEERAKYAEMLKRMFSATIVQIQAAIPQNMVLSVAYEQANENDGKFLRNLTLFLTEFYKNHISLIEQSQELNGYIIPSLELLVRLTEIRDKEQFKVCLEFWLFLSKDLFKKDLQQSVIQSGFSFTTPVKPGGTPVIGVQQQQQQSNQYGFGFGQSIQSGNEQQQQQQQQMAQHFKSPFAPKGVLMSNQQSTSSSSSQQQQQQSQSSLFSPSNPRLGSIFGSQNKGFGIFGKSSLSSSSQSSSSSSSIFNSQSGVGQGILGTPANRSNVLSKFSMTPVSGIIGGKLGNDNNKSNNIRGVASIPRMSTKESSLMASALEQSQKTPRLQTYETVLVKVRKIFIERMAKPEEVLIIVQDNGEVARQLTTDTDQVVLYKTMREALIYLSHLNPDNMKRLLLQKLNECKDSNNFSYDAVNSLCWAIGAISGTMPVDKERDFLIHIVRDLLMLVDQKQKQEERAIVATNIMFVVSLYPRFLREHWKFLRTVAQKLIEFMHEKFPGVMDMATETFMKIAQKCKKKFVTIQPDDQFRFVDEMLNTLPNILSDLSFSQRLNVYESVAWIISGATSDDDKRDLIVRLFQLPNQEWTRIMQAIAGDQTGSQLSLPEAQRQIMLIVAINKRVVAPLGSSYVAQFSLIFMDCVGLYTACSNILKAGINQAGGDGPNGDAAANMHEAQQIRNTRKEILRLFNVFIETADDPHSISTMYLPAILQQVLPQYPSTPKIVRDSEMLTLFTTIIVKLKNLILPQIQEILGALFEATIQMITQNFEDYPEHRSGFYSFLRALNHHCPTALASLPAHGAQMKLVVEAGIWAVKHAEKSIMDLGLQFLYEFIKTVASADVTPVSIPGQTQTGSIGSQSNSSEGLQQFFLEFYAPILDCVLSTITDTFHKQGFRLQCQLFMLLIQLVTREVIDIPLFLAQNDSAVHQMAAQDVSTSLTQSFQQDSSQMPGYSYPNKPDDYLMKLGSANASDVRMQNDVYVRSFIKQFLATTFPNLNEQQNQLFSNNIVQLQDMKPFEQFIRDFLTQLREFAGDVSELYVADQTEQIAMTSEEKIQNDYLVPGMIRDGYNPICISLDKDAILALNWLGSELFDDSDDDSEDYIQPPI